MIIIDIKAKKQEIQCHYKNFKHVSVNFLLSFHFYTLSKEIKS